MANEPTTEPYDPDDRLHEAIASFEEAEDAGRHPDPQEWLRRYPEVAERLVGYFAARKRVKALATPLLPPVAGADPVPEIPDYQILEVIGPGGMGVVYKARQRSTDSVVALKVIRADRLEGLSAEQRRTTIERFINEAQAAAQLEHDHLVKVYKVGEWQGRPFYAMRYVEGSNLAALIEDGPLEARRAAAYVEQVARGVHEAHQHGILHRDLKPANILVDARMDRPLVADFGLAKLLQAGKERTQSNDLMGTPPYMSPEQAQSAARVTVVSDVYSLGATLYALLTGQPPFRGDTPMATLRKVIEEEPAPPRRLQPTVPRDLETICMKCLEKEPRRRYQGAEVLADRLRLFLDNKPIPDRPVSRAERLWRWCRRNPAVAILLASVALVLLTGTAISTFFAFDAAEQANVAQKNENKSNENAAKANKRAEELRVANKDLEKSRDQLEESFARSLLRPLALTAALEERFLTRPGLYGAARRWLPGPLTEPEAEALWELATSQGDSLRLRFIKEALRGPVTTRQLKYRAEMALHAAVGLDPKRRAAAERLLLARLQDPALDPEQRTDVALVAAALGDLPPQAQGRVTAALAAGLRRADKNPVGPAALAQLNALTLALEAGAARMDPTQAGMVLAVALADDNNMLLARRLEAVAGQMEAKEAGEAGALLAAALAKEDYPPEEALARGLAALALRMEPKEAARLYGKAGAAYVAALPKQTEFSLKWLPGQVPRDPRSAVHVTVQKAGALKALGAWLSPKEAAEARAVLAAALLQVSADQGGGPLTQIEALMQALAALSARLDPKDAAQLYAEVGTGLVTRLREARDRFTPLKLVRALAGLAALMKPQEAASLYAKAGPALAASLAKTQRLEDFEEEVHEQLAALAAGMDPKSAAHMATALAAAVAPRTTSWGQAALAHGLAIVATRMEAAQAAGLCAGAGTTLAETLAITDSPLDQARLAKGLAALAALIGPQEAAHLCARGGATLAATLGKTTHAESQAQLAEGLAALAARIEPQAAARLCAEAAAVLSASVAKATDPSDQGALAHGLAALAARMEPKEAARLCAAAGSRLAAACARPTSREGVKQSWVWSGLAALATRMEPKDAAVARAVLVAELAKPPNHFVRPPVEWGLAAVAAHMEPAEVSELAMLLIAELAKTEDSAILLDQSMWRYYGLPKALRAVLRRLDTAEMSRKERIVGTLVASLAGPGQSFQALAIAAMALEPLPSGRAPQQMVDLLKHPACTGAARRVVLDQLGAHYGRHFADQWDFVRFVQDRNLRLDLTTPPQRPAQPALAQAGKR
jgi:serine/threonine protein kinase